LQQAVDTAQNFKPLSDEDHKVQSAGTAEAAAVVNMKCKKSTIFDGTLWNHQWLG
jgi:hypothetical protein